MMRNRTSDYGAARVCKGINLRGREAYAPYTMIQRLSMPAAARDRAQVAPTYLPASCYLPESLDGVWHRPTGWRDKHSIDWLLDLPLMLVQFDAGSV